MTVITHRQAGPFEYQDLVDQPCDGYRREILGGVLIVTPAPNLGHQLVLGRLYVALSAAQHPEMLTMLSPFDWRHPDGGVVQPDLLVMWKRDADRHGPLGPEATPLLVVEILSPSNRAYDRAMKREVGVYDTEAEVSGEDEFSTDAPFSHLIPNRRPGRPRSRLGKQAGHPAHPLATPWSLVAGQPGKQPRPGSADRLHQHWDRAHHRP
ncbi:MAG: Uma2 family endonuclease, partial [Acidimicrobiales bacterium]